MRVATTRGGALTTAQALVEDALRTQISAAGPAARRGLLVIRRLDAGGAGGPAERRAVARRVAGGLAEAAARAVRPGDPSAQSAGEVLFRDPLEPYALYAEALFSRRPVAGAWFYRAIFGHRRGVEWRQAARALLAHALAEPFAAVAAAEILRQACLAGRAEALISLLSPVEIAAISEAFLARPAGGGQAPAPAPARRRPAHSDPPHPPVEVAARLSMAPAPMIGALRRIASSFGTDAPQTRLIAAAALVAAVPAAVSRDLLVEAVGLAMQAHRSAEAADSSKTARIAIEGQMPGSGGAARDAPGASVLPPASPADPPPAPGHCSGHCSVGVAGQADGMAGTDAAGDRDIPAAGEPVQTRTARRPAHRATHDPGRTAALEASDGRMAGRASKPVKDTGPAEASAAREAGLIAAPVDSAPGSGAGAAHSRPPETIAPTATGDAPGQGLPSRWAGAVLAVALITHAAGALVSPPGAQLAEIGRRALRRMLRRAGCPRRDPAIQCFGPTVAARRLVVPYPFALPRAIGLTRATRLVIRRVAGAPGWRALTCRRGLIVFAIWHRRAPGPVREMARSAGRIGRGPELGGALSAHLVRTTELVARAWVRAAAGRHLSALLERPGRLHASRTHLEVTFDARLVDLAVRRCGLDIDPGWCPWLFRVTTIHYHHGGDDA